MDDIYDKLREPLRITDYAFRKANAYAESASGIAGRPIEVMGLLLGYCEDNRCIAVDAVIPEVQVVTQSHAHAKGSQIARLYANAMRSGQKIIGMWHSHGLYNNFHSTVDDSEFQHILVRNSGTLKNELEISGRMLPYASSVVINHRSYTRSDPGINPLIVRDYFCGAGALVGDTPCIVDNVSIEIVRSSSGHVDYDMVLSEVCAGVMYCGRPLADFRPSKSRLWALLESLGWGDLVGELA
ncbi:Mov34/MPN/PAD-1 family protein [Candidatus Woesearchaeota archaeon]|nr:Mov34/MPN/PAD-1 family protein [Candidatus Woesearchaeota archaeon]